jgi:hypothetical protein
MQRSLPGLPRRIGLDLRGDRLYFAEASLGPGGPRLRRYGCERPDDGESLDQMLSRIGGSRWLRHAEVVLPIRHPELRIQRLELPALSSREARIVARRRAIELGETLQEPALRGFAIAPGKEARPAWLSACPEEFARFAHRRWASRGLQASRFVSSQYALGSLAGLMPLAPEGQLRAFLDLADGVSTCVLADAHGWLFGRELSIKVTGDPNSPDDGIDTLERLSAELRRTFHYVATELRMGAVVELYLSGDAHDLEALKLRLEEALGIPTERVGESGIGEITQGFDSGAACALGLVYAPGTRTSNLLPLEATRAYETRATRRRLALALCIPAAILLVGSAHMGITLSTLSGQSEALESGWNDARSERAQVEATALVRQRGREIDTSLEALLESQPPWARVLEALGHLLPDDAVLDRTHSSHDERWSLVLDVEFRGSDLAGAAAAASRFRARLDGSPLFRVRKSERSDAPRLPDEDFVRVRMRITTEIAETVPTGEIATRAEAASHG